MGRKNHPSHGGNNGKHGMGFRRPRDGGDLRSDQEVRGGRTLKAFRNFEEEATSLIGGALLDLSHSEDVPTLSTLAVCTAYIFDPRIMPKNFNEAFISGTQFGRISAQIEHNESIGTQLGYSVALGKVALM